MGLGTTNKPMPETNEFVFSLNVPQMSRDHHRIVRQSVANMSQPSPNDPPMIPRFPPFHPSTAPRPSSALPTTIPRPSPDHPISALSLPK